MYFSTCGRISLHSPILCCYVFVLVLALPPPLSMPPLVRKIWALSSSQASCEICFAMGRDLLQSTLYIYIYIDLSPYPPAGFGSPSKVVRVTSRLWIFTWMFPPRRSNFFLLTIPTPVLPFVHPPPLKLVSLSESSVTAVWLDVVAGSSQ